MNNQFNEPKGGEKKYGVKIVVVIVSIAIVLSSVFGVYLFKRKNGGMGISRLLKTPNYNAEFKYDLENNQLSDFDIAFLKVENTEENKIYSPLSIKYALKMLEEGSDGTTKDQLSNVLGDYTLTKYTSNQNMSLANAFFVKDSFKKSINGRYISNLKKHYDAEIVFDSFDTVDRINEWVKSKTLGIIQSLLDPSDVDKDFILVNALGIDMEWKNKFFDIDFENGFADDVYYNHENYYVSCNAMEVVSKKFKNNKSEVSGMEIFASIDNYDIVSILGEANIRKTVEKAYREWIRNSGTNTWGEEMTSASQIDQEVAKYLDEYMQDIKRNYAEYGETSNTDFLLYTDDDVKAFAKDLKTYNGTTLQYIGIMPTGKTLHRYIKDLDSASLNDIIKNLKELRRERFKDGVITKITGFVPKFNFEYTMDLQNGLAKIGITDVFDPKKANLSGLTKSKGAYISKSIHKANIDFTQDGIKAAAATMIGGKGAGGPEFDYVYDVPVEEIDLTFDQPYMFIIRDKDTGDVWFSGTVYEPLKWENDTTKETQYY